MGSYRRIRPGTTRQARVTVTENRLPTSCDVPNGNANPSGSPPFSSVGPGLAGRCTFTDTVTGSGFTDTNTGNNPDASASNNATCYICPGAPSGGSSAC